MRRCERGGEVTVHLPGQLVLYPILKLDERKGSSFKPDLHEYMRNLEEVALLVAKSFGVEKRTSRRRFHRSVGERLKVCSSRRPRETMGHLPRFSYQRRLQFVRLHETRRTVRYWRQTGRKHPRETALATKTNGWRKRKRRRTANTNRRE